MQSPSQRLFDADVQSAEFRSGTLKVYWGVVAQDLLPDELVWPQVVLWIGAAPRAVAPDRYYVALNVDGYRAAAPTGTFWDSETKTILDTARRPKGKANSRFAKVFRTDWKEGRAFYHPYDRRAADSHSKWRTRQPHLVWTPDHTIVDYLEEIRSLLNSDNYIGV